jgi:hypothetical protein
LLDSGIVGETAPGHYLHGKPKRQSFRTMLKISSVKYMTCGKFLGGDMKACL